MDHVKIDVQDAAEDSLRFRTSGTCAAMYMYSTSSCTVLVSAQAGDSGPPQCLCGMSIQYPSSQKMFSGKDYDYRLAARVL